jgi:hypothetical protein
MGRKYIKSIPTRYKTFRFRSRLEARWAVFFDVLGIEWRYESRSVDLGWCLYIPDFWLPQYRMYAEVKPDDFRSEELVKVTTLVAKTNEECLLLCGSPDLKAYWAVGPRLSQKRYILTITQDYPLHVGRFPSQIYSSEEEFLHDEIYYRAWVAARDTKF